ncbi:UNVERIFIED_CONTAM: hypothetical protein Sindi_0226800 [Sesamum indicum]
MRTGFCRRPSHLPADVLWEIFSYLSVYDLYRAKSISREWNSIISNYYFIQTHRNQTPCLGLLASRANSADREFQFYYARLQRRNTNNNCNFVCRLRVPYSDYEGFTQVVHGLVCFYSVDRVSILNVCTLEMQDLPQPPIHVNIINTHCYLGFDKSSKAYKLVRLTRLRKPPTSKWSVGPAFEILTLTTPISSCRWRGKESDKDADMIQSPSFCVNGHLYWMHSCDYDFYHGCAVVLDLELETFYLAFVPPSDTSRIARRLGVFDGFKIHGSITPLIEAGGVFLTLYSEEAAVEFPVVFPDEVSEGRRYALALNPRTGNRLLEKDIEGEFVVGKFPRFVAPMEKNEKASHIVCLRESLTPLQLLLRPQDDQITG